MRNPPGKAKGEDLILLRKRLKEPPKDTVAAWVTMGGETRDSRRLGHEAKVGGLTEQHSAP